MNEKVKRLNPKPQVLRELFLLSGNLCAFPGCARPIMNTLGQQVGEICHIEAAETSGPRFNKDQTNEQRRAASNLMLMCHEHHVETDDEGQFPVQAMQQMKDSHQKKVMNFITHLQLRVTDLTAADAMHAAVSLARFDPSLAVAHTPSEVQQTVAIVNHLMERIHRLPRPARELLVVVAKRSVPDSSPSRGLSYISIHELRMHCGLGHRTVSELIQVMEEHGFVVDAGPDERGHPRIALRHIDGWNIWSDFMTFEARGCGSAHEIIVDLKFSLLG